MFILALTTRKSDLNLLPRAFKYFLNTSILLTQVAFVIQRVPPLARVFQLFIWFVFFML